ncbi:MAG: FecR domain-containing protein, partial [Syntrophales bacterium]|jgi:uncharacterized membrane protein YgcG|nr:FecR domain-containing protein [Syntrophales bacterium]
VLALPLLAVAAPAGKVTRVEGNVDITRAGATAAKALLSGEAVDVGDVVRTKSKSKAEITFADQNILRIAASSRVTIQKYLVEGGNTSGVMKLHRGMVQAISSVGFIRRLTASPDQNKLEVNTMNATCGIRGSNMIVSYHGGVTSVLFVTGHGYVYNPAKRDVTVPITAGNMSVVEKKDAPPAPPKPISNVELDIKIKAVTPGEKSRSEGELKPDRQAEMKDIGSKGKRGDVPGLGKAPTDAADLPTGLIMKSPGQAAKTLDLKTADRTIKTQAPKSAAPGKSAVAQSKGGGETSGSGGSSGSLGGGSSGSSGKSVGSSGSSGKSSDSGGSSGSSSGSSGSSGKSGDSGGGSSVSSQKSSSDTAADKRGQFLKDLKEKKEQKAKKK